MRSAITLAAVLLLSTPTAGADRVPSESFDLLVRVNGPVRIARGEAIESLVVINHDAIIDGSIEGTVLVINGTARVAGIIDHDLIVVNGRADLSDTARIGGHALLYRSGVTRAAGAIIAGGVHEEMGPSFNAAGGLWWAWISFTVFVFGGGLLFALVARRLLLDGGDLLAREPLKSLGAGICLALALPVLAIVLTMTVVGIPLGLALLLALIPLLTFVGYVVTGASIGELVLRSTRSGEEPAWSRFGALKSAACGLAVLQFLALVPGFGFLIMLLASLAGAGALTYRTWLEWRVTPAEIHAEAA